MPRFEFDMTTVVTREERYIVAAATQAEAIQKAQAGETEDETVVRELEIQDRVINSGPTKIED